MKKTDWLTRSLYIELLEAKKEIIKAGAALFVELQAWLDNNAQNIKEEKLKTIDNNISDANRELIKFEQAKINTVEEETINNFLINQIQQKKESLSSEIIRLQQEKNRIETDFLRMQQLLDAFKDLMRRTNQRNDETNTGEFYYHSAYSLTIQSTTLMALIGKYTDNRMPSKEAIVNFLYTEVKETDISTIRSKQIFTTLVTLTIMCVMFVCAFYVLGLTLNPLFFIGIVAAIPPLLWIGAMMYLGNVVPRIKKDVITDQETFETAEFENLFKTHKLSEQTKSQNYSEQLKFLNKRGVFKSTRTEMGGREYYGLNQATIDTYSALTRS